MNQKEKLTFEGRPEGYAVDAKRGRLYMNYEGKDQTTAIDLKTHRTVAKWQSSCGEDGPHGLSVDQDTGYLFVACSTRAEVLDACHNGEKLSSIDTGDRVDDLNYSPSIHMLYVGAAKDAWLSFANNRTQSKDFICQQMRRPSLSPRSLDHMNQHARNIVTRYSETPQDRHFLSPHWN